MMNKTQFAKAVAAESGETAASTVRVMDAMMKVIGVCMAHDERIVLPGFGSFYTQERPARTMRNPQTGKPLKVAARKTVKFRVGAKLRNRLRKNPESRKSKVLEKRNSGFGLRSAGRWRKTLICSNGLRKS